jgi:uncharacterized membrane protein
MTDEREQREQMEAQERSEERGTGRLEAFSDGVFAIAATLLVLELRIPTPDALPHGESLRQALLHEWPSYLAFGTSFVTILIMWVNHHNLFRMIYHTDHSFLLINGALLLVVSFIPFSTHVLAEYIRESDARTAVVFYNGTFLVMAICFYTLWRYAAHNGRLLAPNVDMNLVRLITRQFNFGPITYAICLVLAFVNVIAGIVSVMALAVYWGLPDTVRPGTRSTHGRAVKESHEQPIAR